MDNLAGKTIILGITGGIAAYKTPDLVSQLRKEGAVVHVIATERALDFVSALSLETMSGNKVLSRNTENIDSTDIEHINLADSADLILIAPATANTIAKLVTGISDNLLFDTILASQAPILVAPAMNTNMWEHQTVQRNIQVLGSMGYHLIEPEFGELACGHLGQGRLPALSSIITRVEEVLATSSKKPQRTAFNQAPSPKLTLSNFNQQNSLEEEDEPEYKESLGPTIQSLAGKKIIITVGATREKIDPVRFITNRSSGKMGFALAKQAVENDAEVVVISTIPNSETWASQTKFIKVESHEDMYKAIFNEFTKANPYTRPADALIMVAAVSDFRPVNPANEKIKKEESRNINSPLDTIVNMINDAKDRAGSITLELEKTPDIVAEMSQMKQAGQIIVGFSVETDSPIENAKKKIFDKGLDFIVVNNTDAFSADEAEVSIIASPARSSCMPMVSSLPKESKTKIARKVLEYLGACFTKSETRV